MRRGRCLGLLALLFSGLASLAAAQYDYQWRTGRASYYGTDGWSIHKGNCGMGYIHESQPAGWDVVALSDQFPNFAGSCGRCYEIKCNPAEVHDGYGKSFDRKSVCLDPSTSLLVRVVDSCPCNYPNNWYSNKRWCCGDADHMDVSIWAFEKLADKKWGVMGIQYRPVPCNYVPQKPAPKIANPTPGEHWPGQEDFIKTGDLKLKKKWNNQQGDTVVQGWQFGDPTGSSSDSSSSSARSSASATASGSSSTATATATSSARSSAGSASATASGVTSSSSSSGGGSSSARASGAASVGFGVHGFGGPPEGDKGGSGGGGSSNASAPSTASSSSTADKGAIFVGQLQNGWYDASYNAKPNWKAGSFGVTGGNVVCATVYPGGALAVGHAKGGFQGGQTLEWWVKTDGGRPQLAVNIGGGSKYCSPLDLPSLPTLDSRTGFSKFAVNLGDFGGSYDFFNGCGGSGYWDLTTIELKNTRSWQQQVCVDGVRLLPRAAQSN